MELTKNCEMMKTYIQGHYDRKTDIPGIIGVVYDPAAKLYGFYFNTDLFVAHKEDVFPSESIDGMKMLLRSISSQAVLIAEATNNGK